MLRVFGFVLTLGLIFLFGVFAAPTLAQDRPESLLERTWSDCKAFERAVAMGSFQREPDLFVCHHFDYKPLKMWGYVRYVGASQIQIVLRTDKHGVCRGDGSRDTGREQGHSYTIASGRYECRDGSQGGLAFTAYTQRQGFHFGTVLAGIDGHRDRIDNERDRIQSEFYIWDRAAIRDRLGLR